MISYYCEKKFTTEAPIPSVLMIIRASNPEYNFVQNFLNEEYIYQRNSMG